MSQERFGFGRPGVDCPIPSRVSSTEVATGSRYGRLNPWLEEDYLAMKLLRPFFVATLQVYRAIDNGREERAKKLANTALSYAQKISSNPARRGAFEGKIATSAVSSLQDYVSGKVDDPRRDFNLELDAMSDGSNEQDLFSGVDEEFGADDELYGLFEKARISGKIERIYRIMGKVYFLIDTGKVDKARTVAKRVTGIVRRLEGISGGADAMTPSFQSTVAALEAFAEGQVDDPRQVSSEAPSGASGETMSTASSWMFSTSVEMPPVGGPPWGPPWRARPPRPWGPPPVGAPRPGWAPGVAVRGPIRGIVAPAPRAHARFGGIDASDFSLDGHPIGGDGIFGGIDASDFSLDGHPIGGDGIFGGIDASDFSLDGHPIVR